MNRWRYRITIYTPADVLGELPKPVDQVPPQIFCDDEGTCYFDAAPNPLTGAVERLLNRDGAEGWELVQLAFRPDQIIGFWKQSVED
ncbi:MAG TPA: hypothetical protein ENN99_12835 [Chloroflexi bacterium]|mgnify:CR=1 FL=1|nr:hypothetical protein [Chloroflexota bacterium]